MTYSQLELCSGHAAFEAVPRPRLSLDLRRAGQRLRDAGVPVLDARVMLIVQLEAETTVSRDGRVLVKSADRGLAERAFRRLAALLELPA